MGRENKSRYALLGMLALEPMSGYQIKKKMQESTSNFWSESYGQIYPMLKQLMQEGLTTSRMERQEGKPERIVYTLTAQGRAELVNWLGESVEEVPERIEILLKLFFGHLLPVEMNIQHIQEFQEIQERLLATYHEIETWLHHCQEESKEEAESLTYALLTVRYGIHYREGLLKWCEESKATLRTKLSPERN